MHAYLPFRYHSCRADPNLRSGREHHGRPECADFWGSTRSPDGARSYARPRLLRGPRELRAYWVRRQQIHCGRCALVLDLDDCRAAGVDDGEAGCGVCDADLFTGERPGGRRGVREGAYRRRLTRATMEVDRHGGHLWYPIADGLKGDGYGSHSRPASGHMHGKARDSSRFAVRIYRRNHHRRVWEER